jgi:hypothetical protein
MSGMQGPVLSSGEHIPQCSYFVWYSTFLTLMSGMQGPVLSSGGHIPDEGILHSRRYETPKCYTALTGWAP